MQWFKRFVRDDRAQDLIEYALIVGFVCFVAFVGVSRMSSGMTGAYISINTTMQPLASAPDSPDGFRISKTGSVTTGEPCSASDDSRTSRCASALSGK